MERDEFEIIGFEIMESDEEWSNSVRMWTHEGRGRVSVELAQDGMVELTADKARQLASKLVELAAWTGGPSETTAVVHQDGAAVEARASALRDQRARVDEVWAEIRALVPEVIERDSAEPLFRAAIERVLTGDSALLPSEAAPSDITCARRRGPVDSPVRMKPQNPPEPIPARTGTHWG